MPVLTILLYSYSRVEDDDRTGLPLSSILKTNIKTVISKNGRVMEIYDIIEISMTFQYKSRFFPANLV